MKQTAVIVAGGKGARMGADMPKQFLLLEGKPILVHTLKAFLHLDPELTVALVLPTMHLETWKQMAPSYLEAGLRNRILLCEGGDSRTASVHAGLKRLEETVKQVAHTLVAIQDGVRPFSPSSSIRESFRLAETHGAAVTCVPVKASIRQRQPDGSTEAVDRSDYLEVQTPQTFRLDHILDAYARRPHDAFTDDASLYEAMIGAVAICEGSYDNIKITTPEDLFVAKRILGEQQPRLSSSRQVGLVVLDVDGTLTDGGIYLDEAGGITRRFHARDTLAIHRAMTRHQLRLALISAGSSPEAMDAMGKALGVPLTYAGPMPKLTVVSQWLEAEGLSWQEVAFVGDDLNDLPLMQRVGLAACPEDAAPQVLEAAHLRLQRAGGQGCVRELLETHLGLYLDQ